MATIPEGATHRQTFYGNVYYYRKRQVRYMNQASETWQTRYEWDFWDNGKWAWAGPAVRSTYFEELPKRGSIS